MMRRVAVERQVLLQISGCGWKVETAWPSKEVIKIVVDATSQPGSSKTEHDTFVLM
jgi:hypothetical protein